MKTAATKLATRLVALLALLGAPLSPPALAGPAASECTEDAGPLAAIADATRAVVDPALPLEVDTLVIGSGPGGGTVAARLAEAGQRVALLDAGNMQVLPIS